MTNVHANGWVVLSYQWCNSTGLYGRLYPPTRTIILTLPSHPDVESSSQQGSREARPYGELQVPT